VYKRQDFAVTLRENAASYARPKLMQYIS